MNCRTHVRMLMSALSAFPTYVLVEIQPLAGSSPVSTRRSATSTKQTTAAKSATTISVILPLALRDAIPVATVSEPPKRWETPLCVCGNVLHTFPVVCQSCWPNNIGPEFVTIFRLCFTCPSLSWHSHVMLAGCNITWWPATWFFRPGSVASIKSKTGPKVSSLVRTRVDGCVVARGFRRSVRLWMRIFTHLFDVV